jgi:hypothetical protein
MRKNQWVYATVPQKERKETKWAENKEAGFSSLLITVPLILILVAVVVFAPPLRLSTSPVPSPSLSTLRM